MHVEHSQLSTAGMWDGRSAQQQHTEGARQLSQPPASEHAGCGGRSCPLVNTAHRAPAVPRPPRLPLARWLGGLSLAPCIPRPTPCQNTYTPARIAPPPTPPTPPTHHAHAPTHAQRPASHSTHRYLVERLTDGKQYALKLTDMSQLEEPLRSGWAGG